MESAEKRLNTFSTRVRQMIIQYQAMKDENAGLYAMVDERDAKITLLEEQLKQAKQEYDNLDGKDDRNLRHGHGGGEKKIVQAH